MKIQLNNQFKLLGVKDYQIDGIIHQSISKLSVEKKDSDFSLRHKKLINIISDLTDSAST
jgi:hypothetical protein